MSEPGDVAMRGARGKRWSQPRAAAAVIALGLVATGCSGSRHHAAPPPRISSTSLATQTVTPPASSTATETVTPPPATTAATNTASAPPPPSSTSAGSDTCATSQLRVKEAASQGAGGTVITRFNVTTATPCVLQGYFGAAGYGATNTAVFTMVGRYQASTPRIDLKPSSTVYFTVRTSDIKQNGNTTACPIVTAMHLTPPNQRPYLTVSGLHVIACHATASDGVTVTPVSTSP